MQWQSEIAYQDPRTEAYLGSPSVVRTPDGALLASFDRFGSGAPRAGEVRWCLTSVYRSEDDGRSWQRITHLVDSWWSSLFVHDGATYLLGTSGYCGDIVVRRSTDGGFTWTKPLEESSGLLFAAGEDETPPNYHCAPTPVVEHDGRLYRAFEDKGGDETAQGEHDAFVVSCDPADDLLDASNWRMSEKLSSAVLPGDSAGTPPNWREGNVVVGPDGDLWNVLRTNDLPERDTAAVLRVEDGGRRVEFDGVVDLPGGESKFTIRRDPETGAYLMLSNPNTDPDHHTRNVLAMYASADLRDWRRVRTLMTDDLLEGVESIESTGFQYPDWQFDGDDVVYVVRTAYDSAENMHDSNRITFDAVSSFRELLPSDVLDRSG